MLKEWMNQREMLEFIGTTKANVSIHLSKMAIPVDSFRREIRPSKQGRRTIFRRIKEYRIEVLHAIAISGRRVDEANQIRRWAKRRKIAMPNLVTAKKEHEFAKLMNCLSGAVKIIPQ
jgi:hypothetical protein